MLRYHKNYGKNTSTADNQQERLENMANKEKKEDEVNIGDLHVTPKHDTSGRKSCVGPARVYLVSYPLKKEDDVLLQCTIDGTKFLATVGTLLNPLKWIPK